MAHLAADLLKHDVTRRYTPDEFATLSSLFRLGAEITTQVNDHTTFRIRGAAAFADWYLWRLSWLLRDGVYRARDLQRARDVLTRAFDRPDDLQPARMVALLSGRADDTAAALAAAGDHRRPPGRRAHGAVTRSVGRAARAGDPQSVVAEANAAGRALRRRVGAAPLDEPGEQCRAW